MNIRPTAGKNDATSYGFDRFEDQTFSDDDTLNSQPATVFLRCTRNLSGSEISQGSASIVSVGARAAIRSVGIANPALDAGSAIGCPISQTPSSRLHDRAWCDNGRCAVLSKVYPDHSETALLARFHGMETTLQQMLDRIEYQGAQLFAVCKRYA
jgi:hypothetical protein